MSLFSIPNQSFFRISQNFSETSVTLRPNICHFFEYLFCLQQTEFTHARGPRLRVTKSDTR